MLHFGGGWSIIAQMRQLYVEKKHVITDEELLDLTSVAKSLPGTTIANVAMLYGYRAGGLIVGFLSVFGMVFPPMVILIAVSFFYQAFRGSYWVMAAMEGMQAAGIPGAIAANLGTLTPALTLCTLAAVFFTRFRESRMMQRILLGVRPACLGMVLGVIVTLAGSTYLKQGSAHLASIGIGLLDLVLVVKYKVSIPIVILLSAGLGILLFGIIGIPIPG